MSKTEHLQAQLDWSTANVSEGRLAVAFDERPDSEWVDRLRAVVERIERPGSAWGTIKVKRRRVKVADVKPGAEDELRVFLEGAVLQTNADFRPDEAEQPGEGGERSEADETMTARFRSFAPSSS